VAGSNEYHFITRWRHAGSPEEVYDTLKDALALPRWWPSVYLDVKQLDPGGSDGIGRRIELFTKGWLPYTLRWNFVVTEAARPAGLQLEASGDFVGRGIWRLERRGEHVETTYDWRVRADKPLLRRLSFLMKPIFSMNHQWAMARGDESLALELERRRAKSDAERARIPPPPGPTFAWLLRRRSGR
jgi:hypothetical protein